MFIVLLAAVLPAIAILYFIYRKDDLRTEPPKQIVSAFFLGMLSALASMLISTPLNYLGFFTEEASTTGEHLAHAFFGAAFPEELAKLVILWMFLRKNAYFDEWVDGIVYAACVGLGFAALENVFYLFEDLDEWVTVGILRAFMSIPAHFFFAVTMGYFVSRACFGDYEKHRWNSILALVCPMILHTLYDFPLMMSETSEIAGSLLFLFFGLYIFMAVKSKKFYLAHHAVDAEAMGQSEDSDQA
ncbi:MAG: PrsW family intramembrane metalloprotease [Bacteroidales bacterium]|nr:PrsW family intramembrane metalloprotease [Bacteroidales bacterium]